MDFRAFDVGDVVDFDGKPARIIGKQQIFGEPYVDIFCEPNGPVRRVKLNDVTQRPSPHTRFSQHIATHPARFAAQTIAYLSHDEVGYSGS